MFSLVQNSYTELLAKPLSMIHGHDLVTIVTIEKCQQVV